MEFSDFSEILGTSENFSDHSIGFKDANSSENLFDKRKITILIPKRIYRYKRANISVNFPRGWTNVYGIRERLIHSILRASFYNYDGNMVICRICPCIMKIAYQGEKVEETTIELIFECRSICTSSRDHLRGDIKMGFNFPGIGTVFSEFFSLFARKKSYRKKRKIAPVIELSTFLDKVKDEYPNSPCGSI